MLRAQHPANTNAFYVQLRSLLPGSDVITVKNLVLKRDAATFTFSDGSFAFYGDVNGKVTGAVFRGQGHLHITPPTAEERHNLSLFTQSDEFDEDFDQAVLRFTDGTAAELHKAATGKGTFDSAFTKAAEEFRNYQRNTIKDNDDLRLLADVLSPAPGGYFLAALHGHKDPHLIFTLDPHGASNVEPEEVSLVNWNSWGPAFLTAFHSSSVTGDDHNETYNIDKEDLDTSIAKGGFLTGLATVHIVAAQNGLAVVPLNLYPTLRVSSATTDKGETLDYVQEDKDHDADFGVILAHPLNKGDSISLRIAYGGKDVVQSEGNANYYPVARESWYPNASQELGSYATYHMLFHVPKGLQLIATGTQVSEKTEGKITTSEWKTDVPLAVVGFSLGQFTMKSATIQYKSGGSLTVNAYANTQVPDVLKTVEDAVNSQSVGESNGSVGNIDTASMLPVALSQGQVAAEIYTNLFGVLPFTHISLTQQFACNYGQSWPMLVYLPICGFFDSTQQHVFGLRPEDMYWRVVTPHEVAHQWWGQTVGFHSYRDQWMSEGFADTSAAIFLEATRKKPDDYRDFWKQQRKLITEKNAMGFRPIDVGPVTMGFRLSTQKTGWDIYQNLVYPKGAYILHMIRMMMWSPRDGDARFASMMHDFVKTYWLKPATTEDFKAMVEKYMTPGMDLERNHTMDWFFREYVYGTDLPAYHFESQVIKNSDYTSVHFKLTQSGVSADFKNIVPVYLELADGRIIRLGEAAITGSKTIEQTIRLPKMPSDVTRMLINYNYDVLCTDD